MKDFSKEIRAHALRNALEHGEAKESAILPKLFQHGLNKKDIREVMPSIKEIVSEVNSMSEESRRNEFDKVESIIPEREEREEGLPELPGIKDGKYKGKKVKMRIAPFPSGALHLGNAKTFLINAMYAEKYQGKVILVMDDTIGSEKKPIEKEAYGLIKDALKFLKIKYEKEIIYKSDRLETYYKYARELIKKGKAYVDFSTQAEFQKLKEQGKDPGDKHLGKEVHLGRFEEMFKMKEGHAVLRIDTGMNHKNPAFRDRVLFKISDRKHERIGKKYRVWPTLEMTWAVDDHLLGITHIIRGNELMIETEMEEYIWDIFGWDKPEVIHTGLVNIEVEGQEGKVSKSKARDEVKSGKYSGWDDPRTWSIQSLERRGIKAEAIREFVESIGLNKQDVKVPIDTLYSMNRKILDSEANRYYFVETPEEIEIKGSEGEAISDVKIEKHPDKEEMREVSASSNIFISSNDFKELKGKEVRLLHLCNIILNKKAEKIVGDLKTNKKVQWVDAKDFARTQVLMPSGKFISGAAESGVKKLKKGEIIQFERFGFCRFDGKKRIKGIGDVYQFWFAHR